MKMSQIEKRAKEIVEEFLQEGDSDEFITTFGEWCGKYGRFTYANRDALIRNVVKEMKKHGIEVRK